MQPRPRARARGNCLVRLSGGDSGRPCASNSAATVINAVVVTPGPLSYAAFSHCAVESITRCIDAVMMRSMFADGDNICNGHHQQPSH